MGFFIILFMQEKYVRKFNYLNENDWKIFNIFNIELIDVEQCGKNVYKIMIDYVFEELFKY